MSQTNIEYFNSTLVLFIKDINKIYPEYKHSLNEYYNDLLISDNCNDDKYIKRFMRKFQNLKNSISSKDESIFSDDCYLLKNVDFQILWKDDITTDKIKDTIWDYLQTLFVIGETIISDSEKIKNLVNNFKKIRNNEPLELEANSNNEDNNTSEKNIVENDENIELMNMIKNLSEKKTTDPKIDEELLNNGLIGNLAKELSVEINMDYLNLNLDENSDNINDIFTNLMSGDNPMKFMNLIQNVVQKIHSKL